MIESPNYPNAYPNDCLCVWLFEADSHDHVRVEFPHDFSTAGPNDA